MLEKTKKKEKRRAEDHGHETSGAVAVDASMLDTF